MEIICSHEIDFRWHRFRGCVCFIGGVLSCIIDSAFDLSLFDSITKSHVFLSIYIVIIYIVIICFSRLHGNVETMAVLSSGGLDGGKRRDSIILTFHEAKISVLEFDDSIHGLRTRLVKFTPFHQVKIIYSKASKEQREIGFSVSSLYFSLELYLYSLFFFPLSPIEIQPWDF